MDKIFNLENYEKIEKIGKGSFGDVFKIRDKTTNIIYAEKVGYKSLEEKTKDEKIHLVRDVNFLSQLNHPAILKFIGFNLCSFGKKRKPIIITEYSPTGSLFDLLELERNGLAPKTWNATTKLINIYGIASAMSYLHSNNIIHRNLKPQNILENEYLFPKISDFSFSKIYHHNLQSITIQSTFGIKSTPIYIAPEIWKNNQYTKKGDVYAFAFIVYEIMTAERPFNDYSSFKFAIDSIQNGKRPKFHYKIQEAYRSLINRCWADDPEKRPDFDQIVIELKQNRDYITEEVDLNDFLDYVHYVDQFHASFDPNKKILSIEEILNKRKTKLLTKTVFNDENSNIQKQNSSTSEYENKNPQSFYEELISNPFFSRMDRHLQKFFKYVINEDSKERTITFNHNNLSTLSDWLPSDEFISILKLFDNIEIEMKFPCSDFQNIFKIVAKIKKDNLEGIQAHLLVSSRETKFIIGDNEILNTVKISPFVKTICDSTFSGCKLLKEIEIPPSVTKIGEMAFSSCIRLEEIKINSTVEFVGKGAFKGCISLKQITINPMKTKVDFTAFQNCRNLHSMIVTSDDSNIVPFNDEPFYGITKIIIDSSVNTITKFSFKRFLNIKEVVIPKSVSCIEHSAFAGCLSLKKINITDIETLNICMFYGCSSLSDFNFPSNLRFVECFSFFGCSSLKEIILPQSVLATGRYTFAHCNSVRSIKLSDSLVSIGEASFIDCSSLEKIEFPPDLKYIDHRAFEGCKELKRVHLPSSIKYLGEYVFNSCISLEEVTYSDQFNINYVPVGMFNNCSSLATFDLTSFSTICESAFRGCSSLSNIKFPDKLKTIEENAFRDCNSLKEIDIPRYLTAINESAFMNCSSLEKINFEMNSLSSIDDHVFDGCISLKEIIIPPSISTIGMYSFHGCTSLSKVVIPKSVYSIGSCSFMNCQNLVDIEIPFNLKEIGEDCFKGCTSLKNVP